MAVVDQSTTQLVHPVAAVENTGARLLQIQKVITLGASESDLSKYFLGELPDMAVIESITLEGAAVTGFSSADVGLYNVDGSVISANCLASALDLSTTSGLGTGPTGSPIRPASTAIGAANATKRVFELASHVNKAYPASGETNRKAKYRVILTANTRGSGTGTLVARIRYAMAV